MTTEPTLLVLAAGMGSRFGGLKQLAALGPAGETIMDYSVFDAARAGFTKVVFIIRAEMETQFREIVGNRVEKRLPVQYAFQEMEKIPGSIPVPAGRQKPWGTGHAILMAEPLIDGPFAAINADDFYGAASFRLLTEHWRTGAADYAMAGFILRNTLSEFGTVARGRCEVDSEGYLQSVTELTQISPSGNGAQFVDSAGGKHPLTGQETVSMNMWGFNPGLFAHLRREMELFLRQSAQDNKAEFFIPTVVNTLVQRGEERVKVLSSPDSWLGVTYREDLPRVQASVRELIRQGAYPDRLWPE